MATGLSIYQTKTAKLLLGDTLQLNPTFTPENVFNKTLTYTSSDTTIATVSSTGLITALAEGSATITATTTDGSNKTDTINLTVIVIKATAISISDNKKRKLPNGGTLQLTPTFTPENVFNKTLTYASNNNAIATISPTGLISALALGTATITATTTDGSNKTDTINITVVVPDADVSIKNFKLNDGARDYILTANGDNFIFPNAPRSLSLPATTLTATFDLGSQHATISPDPRTTPLSYASKTQFTVTSGDETVTHTYYVNVGADAYDATTNPYGIYTQDQLSDVTNDLTASYKLMNNIALTGGNWAPIGGTGNTSGYAGTFDGNGKVISNLSISINYVASHIGFFGAIDNSGNVKNLGIAIASAGIEGPAVSVSGLAGLNQGKISNCYVTGGNMQANGGSGAYVGGLVGNNDVSGIINNCYAKTNVTGNTSRFIGVLVGSNTNGGQINNCYAVGTPTPNGATATGAIVGASVSNAGLPASVVSNCYWDSTIYSTGTGVGIGTATGATGKTTADMKASTTVDLLNGTPSSGAWKLNSGGYPKLSWE